MISTVLPVLTSFSSSQKEAGFSLLLPPSTHTRLLLPAVSTVISGISQSEVTGAGDFPVGAEDGGAECKVLGLCLLRLHPRSTLQGFPHRVHGLQCHCHQCWKKGRKQLFQSQPIFRASKDLEILIWCITLIIYVKNIRPQR